jgi:hypothetical protein
MPSYLPRYENSWALVVGINAYQRCGTLGYARNDAQGFAELLVGKLGFPQQNLVLLQDHDATRANIMSSFLRFTHGTKPNDRVVVFFAGHGHTKTGRRGDVGFLVPVDGECEDIGGLIRWDDLTRNADLIPAKHVLFVMDACYGGLAIPRYVHPGSMRFLKDMLRRYSRQVLTAGKADEVVADAGGPRPGHSVFTGHLLDALDGAAASADGVLTANGVMAYVYDRVAKDVYSHQTPHYGFIEGDGDLIFSGLPAEQAEEEGKDKDVLVTVPPSFAEQAGTDISKEPVDTLKEYLSEPRHRIKLADLVTAQVRRVLAQIGPSSFPVQGGRVDAEEFANRLKRYEKAVEELLVTAALLGRWASAEHQSLLQTMPIRLAEANERTGGTIVWLGLRWYPVMLLLYVAGIAAISAENYTSLATILTTKLHAQADNDGPQEIIVPTVEGLLEVEGKSAFKMLPGHERHLVPRSEYMFKALQPVLEDVFFLGRSYEWLFDRFEVLFALVYSDVANSGWGPIGRFGWKHRHRADKPYGELRSEADRQRDDWPPIRAGLFRGLYTRFNEVATAFEEQSLKKLQRF